MLLSAFLVSSGFVRSTIDTCLFTYAKGKLIFWVLIYVDDCLIVENDESLRSRFVTDLGKRFPVVTAATSSGFWALPSPVSVTTTFSPSPRNHTSRTCTPLRCGVAPPENSVTNSRADCALTQQMIGCIKAISPCVKSASAKLFLDLHTVLAPSGEGRRTSASAQVERAGWCCRRFDSDTQTRCGSVTAMVFPRLQARRGSQAFSY